MTNARMMVKGTESDNRGQLKAEHTQWFSFSSLPPAPSLFSLPTYPVLLIAVAVAVDDGRRGCCRASSPPAPPLVFDQPHREP